MSSNTALLFRSTIEIRLNRNLTISARDMSRIEFILEETLDAMKERILMISPELEIEVDV